jgi:hypothetical protein
LNCSKGRFKVPALLLRAGQQKLSIKNWLAAGSVTNDSDVDSGNWLGNWRPVWVKPFHWLARIGRTPRQRIDSFSTGGLINEMAILAGHFQATRVRFAATDGPILVLQDTTEFSYTRESKKAIGILYKSCGRKDKDGRPRLHTLCGILMHSSLAVTAEGLPLGLAAIKFWTRRKL